MCERCVCNDPAEEAELSEQLDALRCCCDGCRAGLSYVLQVAGTEEQIRQCVLCAGKFCVED